MTNTNEQVKSFFELYNQALSMRRWNCVTLSRKLAEEKEMNISPRSLQRYRKKEMRPQFQIAKAIFEVLDVDITDEEIQDSLEYAKEEKLLNRSESEYIERGIRLRISLLSDDETKSTSDILDELKQRIAETQVDTKANFNHYLTELIKYDLANHILPEVDNGRITLAQLIARSSKNQ